MKLPTLFQTLRFAIVASVAFSVVDANAADQKWWHTSSPNATTNGQITLKNSTGVSRTINNNPTGATLATRTANTQPPTVVVQATASLPVVSEGSPCNPAVDTAGISVDRTLLLTCQSDGKWRKGFRFSISEYVVSSNNAGSGSVDLGYHKLCAMSGMGGERPHGYVYRYTGTPDVNGSYGFVGAFDGYADTMDLNITCID